MVFAMVYRAKGTVKDIGVRTVPSDGYVYNPSETHPAFLITEAMRGYGGVLRLPNSQEFMQKYDKTVFLLLHVISLLELFDHEMKIHGLNHVCLDVTHKDAEETKHHFPHIYEKCLSIGIDITKEYIPVLSKCSLYLWGYKGRFECRKFYS